MRDWIRLYLYAYQTRTLIRLMATHAMLIGGRRAPVATTRILSAIRYVRTRGGKKC